MDVKSLQRRLRDFAAARDWQSYHVPKNLAMALMVEAAELLELFQWQTLAESRVLTRDAHNKERVADEVADVLLYLLQLADHTGVDIDEAVERKLRKNAEKYPAKHSEPPPAAPSPVQAKVHLLVDWENVQPTGEALKALVPHGTDVWLFHGPHQKVNLASHQSVYGDRVIPVPRSGAGKNALDFQLTYYVGYIAARQANATFAIVSNDQGYDPMLEHARELGFDARRYAFRKLLHVPGTGSQAVAAEPAVLVPDTGLEVVQTRLVQPPPASLPAMDAAKEKPNPVAASAQATKPPPAKKTALAKKAQPSAASGAKATRQDVKQLTQMLQRMEPWERPGHREVLLVLLQTGLGEHSSQSPRVAHALAQLQAQKHVALKGDQVSYPSGRATQASPSALVEAKKKAVPTKKAAAPAKHVPGKVTQKTTAPQIALAVLASLEKMPKNKPTRHAGLLKFIETHAAKAADPQVMAQRVCALLETRKHVALSPDGKGVTYPKTKKDLAL